MTIKFSDITGGGIPYGNNAGRPANPGLGKLYSNGEASRLEIYTNTGWQNIVQETPGVVSISGNYNESAGSNEITINGTNFGAGAVAYAVGTNGIDYQATTTTVSSIVSIVATFSGLSPQYEPYDIKIVNPSNLYGTLPDVLYINNTPLWNTASGSIADVYETFPISTSVSASDAEGSSITYSLYSGALPSGVTLNSSTGAITGTAPSVGGNTTYSFTINASDGANTSLRSFSILVRDMVAPTSIEYLLAGGGGGGGQDVGGGGGAGGLLTGTLSPSGSYSISVGARGAGGTASGGSAPNGGNTTGFGLTALGGGGGGNYPSGNGAVGGSGGGGSGYSSPGTSASGTVGQGYAGGARAGTANNQLVGAGGGGAGGVGSAMINTDSTWTSNVPNPGGPGVVSSITGSAITYCEGGRAWGDAMPAGQSMRVPSATQFGFGGDGAGTGATALGESTNESGTRGGPGVLIIAYPNTARPLTIDPALTYDTPTRSGYRVYRFTAGSGTITF